MKDRIKLVRTEARMTQAKFGEHLNLKQQTIAVFENGSRNPSDRTISDICERFDINEEWLRYGTGKKNKDISEDDRFSINLSRLGQTDNVFIINTVNLLAETDPQKLKVFEQVMKDLLGFYK